MSTVKTAFAGTTVPGVLTEGCGPESPAPVVRRAERSGHDAQTLLFERQQVGVTELTSRLAPRFVFYEKKNGTTVGAHRALRWPSGVGSVDRAREASPPRKTERNAGDSSGRRRSATPR